MFKSINLPAVEQQNTVVIRVEGREVYARQGQTLATAMLGAGVVPFRRTPVSSSPRTPLCLMGVCFDCLVEVDGVQNVQSCLIEVLEGMQVRLPVGARRAGGQA